MEHVFETPGAVRLRVAIGAGDIQVETADRTQTEVHLIALNRAAEEVIGQMVVRCEERGGRYDVVVEEPKRGFMSSLFNNAEIGVRVHCPREVDVELPDQDPATPGCAATSPPPWRRPDPATWRSTRCAAISPSTRPAGT